MTTKIQDKLKAEGSFNQIKLLCQMRKKWRQKSSFTYEDLKKMVKKHQKTEKGLITLRYSWLKKQAEKKSLDFSSKEEFSYWSINDYDFQNLYASYSSSGFKSKFSPVVRRIDANKEFALDNLIWEVNMKACGNIKIEDEQGRASIYSSAREAERKLDCPQGVISRALRTTGRYKKLTISFA